MQYYKRALDAQVGGRWSLLENFAPHQPSSLNKHIVLWTRTHVIPLVGFEASVHPRKPWCWYLTNCPLSVAHSRWRTNPPSCPCLSPTLPSPSLVRTRVRWRWKSGSGSRAAWSTRWRRRPASRGMPSWTSWWTRGETCRCFRGRSESKESPGLPSLSFPHLLPLSPPALSFFAAIVEKKCS